MLQQSLARSLRTASRAALRVIPECEPCQCRCGVTYAAPRRDYATHRRAPSTRNRQWEEKHGRATRVGLNRQYIQQRLNFLYKHGEIRVQPDEIQAFIGRFRTLVAATKGGITPDPKQIRTLLDDFGIDDQEALKIPPVLMGDMTPDNLYLGKKLILSLSRVGNIEASIRIMADAIYNSKKNPRILHSREIVFAKDHLSLVANQKLNYRAMVCEGKVAHALGNEERAIQMWTDAMAAAVAAAEEREAKERGAGTPTTPESRVPRDPLELSTPWIELMLIHWHRYLSKGMDELAQCEWAMTIGCEQDDPTSHYYASTFVKRRDSQGSHVATSEWLYHVTKAASSGHPKAAYELAVFYAESGWKYIEDEPPDHVKPTPFDSYPAKPATFGNLLLSFVGLNSLLSILGLKTRAKARPQESIFHSAMFPTTAAARQEIAYAWLGVAIGYCYAPAYLFAARMLLEKNLWAGAHAPNAALSLSPSRYTYASKEDYHAGVPISHNEQSSKKNIADPPNPFRNEEEAKKLLREVFYAHEANDYAGHARRAYAKSRRSGHWQGEEEILEERFWRDFGPNVQKFFRFPEIREMYEDEIESLYKQAKELCDRHQFDIYDNENALIYKAGTGKKRKTVPQPPKVRMGHAESWSDACAALCPFVNASPHATCVAPYQGLRIIYKTAGFMPPLRSESKCRITIFHCSSLTPFIISFDIAISTVAVHSGIYSLQQAAVMQSKASAQGTSTITLFETGCDFRDENIVIHRNCTQACTQPAVLWSNPFTIHNCLIYSTVSGLIARKHLIADGERQAAELAYLPNFNLALIEHPANKCMQSFCLNQRHANPSIRCPSASINTTYFSNATKGKIHNLLSDAFIQNEGIGVYIGYLMQLSILLDCWIHGRLISSWLKSLTFVIFAPFGLQRARQHALRVKTRLDKSHQGAALTSGLLEFQQAQSYFALTLSGTAIGALCSNGAMFDVQSLQQMRLAVDLPGDVAATAIICLTFGLYMLHAENKRTWYVTFLSLIAIRVSFATWVLTCLPLRNLHQMNPTGFDVPACGNRSPATFCLDQNSWALQRAIFF
ncbi:hypothetical protein AC579_577 [Pseudocercospora musae]|uniref:Uncharacterized protein n=1 Tax=Pseudocercospora musae TaxID=113226 RepID=A0A139ICC4_9PEZI|nr:hypothetical protein AC579_577 [Pseudocercospora musae]